MQLRKEGTSFAGCCPFHEERTASFKVFPDWKRFKCFGCGAAGDVFEFFRKLEGKNFPAILRPLAHGVGVDVPERELTPVQKRAHLRPRPRTPESRHASPSLVTASVVPFGYKANGGAEVL